MSQIVSFKDRYEFLSNFYPCIITYKGITYPSVEHAYQALKTTDLSERQRIANLATPALAKKAGKALVKREDWEDLKQAVMLLLLQIKFEDPTLRQMLLETGQAELIEGNWWGDKYWGQCPIGVGNNILGKLLMALRDLYQPKQRTCRECGGYNSDSNSSSCVPCQMGR